MGVWAELLLTGCQSRQWEVAVMLLPTPSVGEKTHVRRSKMAEARVSRNAKAITRVDGEPAEWTEMRNPTLADTGVR